MNKLLITIAVFFLLVGTANAQLSVVQRKNNNNASAAASIATGNFNTDPVAGRLIVVLVMGQDTVASVTDTIGNTYSGSVSNPGGVGVNNTYIFYTINSSTAADSITATFDTSSAYSTITAYEVSGNHATPYIDDDMGAALSGTDIQTIGTISVGGGTAIIFAIFTSDAAGNTPETPTPDAGYTMTMADSLGYIYDMYHVTSSNEFAGATTVNSDAWSILAASFAQGAAGTTARDLTLRGVGQ